MIFIWHHALWLLLALPVLAGAYACLRARHKSETALRYAAFRNSTDETRASARVITHLPALLLLAALIALLLSIARPVLVTTAPATEGTIVLLIDVSISMAASDVEPTRLAAARAAARAFVQSQPRDVHIGVVAFGGEADVVQLPTTNRAEVMTALDRLELQRYTAIGNGIMAALLTLVPTADVPRGYDIFGTGRAPPGIHTIPLHDPRTPAAPRHKPVPPGSYLSAAIILVSDGLGTMGVPATQAAKMAADHGIRIYSVGVGTLYGGIASIEGWEPIHADFDEQNLIKVADITRGEYFLARDAGKVTTIYEKLGRRVILQKSENEITVLFIAIAALLSLTAAGFSLLRIGH
jgi:Ca-activated chloride channel family protein